MDSTKEASAGDGTEEGVRKEEENEGARGQCGLPRGSPLHLRYGRKEEGLEEGREGGREEGREGGRKEGRGGRGLWMEQPAGKLLMKQPLTQL